MTHTRSLSRRLRGALPFALAGLLLAGTSASSDQQEAPFDSARTREHCSDLATAANLATDSTNCEVSATADADTGAVSASTRVVSPYKGRAAWNTFPSASDADIVATYQLSEPTPRLDFVIKMRVNHASAMLDGSPLNHLGDGTYGTIARGLENRVLPIAMRRSVHVSAGAHALYTDCSDCGGGGTSLIVLSNDEPRTTVTTSDEEVVVPLKVSRAGDKELPPGEITIRTGMRTIVWHDSWGEAEGNVDATVTGISLEE